ncbi:uncharacterized protein LOC126264260 [Aethina tumida]|uniref:uncharacterized protein LOC126264260 n=1 Tax=Aethina tumida TaxID=116153 RepID=UPI002147E4A0|nr:uncharacterized protein LOC126264260 [Aethina tumida]
MNIPQGESSTTNSLIRIKKEADAKLQLAQVRETQTLKLYLERKAKKHALILEKFQLLEDISYYKQIAHDLHTKEIIKTKNFLKNELEYGKLKFQIDQGLKRLNKLRQVKIISVEENKLIDKENEEREKVQELQQQKTRLEETYKKNKEIIEELLNELKLILNIHEKSI